MRKKILTSRAFNKGKGDGGTRYLSPRPPSPIGSLTIKKVMATKVFLNLKIVDIIEAIEITKIKGKNLKTNSSDRVGIDLNKI